MEIAAIIIGIIILILIIIIFCISEDEDEKFDFGGGLFMGFITAFLFMVEILIIVDIINDPKPTAIDVYRDKTTLEYTIRDGVKIDSIVVFKDSIYGKEN